MNSKRLIIFMVFIILSVNTVSAAKLEYKTFNLKNIDMTEAIKGERPDFPKYTTQLINLANRNSQATRPRVVGQLSELIQEYPGNDYHTWEAWYQKRHPKALAKASAKTWKMIQNLQTAIKQIDQAMVHRWVKDLVLTKTYVGLNFQEAILKTIAAKTDQTWRLANPKEESCGIDGYIGKKPVSVKPVSYKSQVLPEKIGVQIIYYKKVRGGIRVYQNGR